MKIPKVAVIITNWNGKVNTEQCIISLKTQTYQNYWIIVVDNASTDDSVAYLKEKFHDIVILKNKENLGWTGGCNTGINYAMKSNADYFFILNNDITLDENVIEGLVKIAESNDNIGIIGPRIRSASNHEIILSPGINRNYRTLKLKYSEGVDNGQYTEIKDVNWIDDMTALIKKELIENIGVYDVQYFMYAEDSDLCYRATNKGYKIFYIPYLTAYHIEHGSTGEKFNSFIAYYVIRNYILFMRKYYSKRHFIIIIPFIFAMLIVNSITSILKGQWDVPKAMINGILWHTKNKINKHVY